MGTIKRFEDLEIWQLSRTLSADIFSITACRPLAQDFALKNQMLRSAGSIMDNIAEGFGRGSRLEFIQFLSIAKASVSELQSLAEAELIPTSSITDLKTLKFRYMSNFIIIINKK